MTTLKYSVVDAFTTVPFGGNPAAVIVLDTETTKALPDITLQRVAREFNLSETAFIYPIEPQLGRFRLRWFTPTKEVPLCGHATLAASFVIFTTLLASSSTRTLYFETLSGVHSVNLLLDGRIELEFPSHHPVAASDALATQVTETIARAFAHSGSTPTINYIGTGQPGSSLEKYLLVDLDNVDLKGATVDSSAFLDFPQFILVTITQKPRDGEGACASRAFGPTVGVPEDPVCGSAHCLLGPYWSAKLSVQGETELDARQVSERSGILGLLWDRERGKVKIRGYATLTAMGEMYGITA